MRLGLLIRRRPKPLALLLAALGLYVMRGRLFSSPTHTVATPPPAKTVDLSTGPRQKQTATPVHTVKHSEQELRSRVISLVRRSAAVVTPSEAGPAAPDGGGTVALTRTLATPRKVKQGPHPSNFKRKWPKPRLWSSNLITPNGAGPMLVIATTQVANPSPEKTQIQLNTIRALKSMRPLGSVLPYVFTTSLEWARVCRSEGVGVFMQYENRTEMQMPTIRGIMSRMKKIAKQLGAPFHGYVNGDIIFTEDLLVTLRLADQAIKNSFVLPKTGVLMVGQRRNCPFGNLLANLDFNNRCQLAVDIGKVLKTCTLMTPMAIDYFISSEQTMKWDYLDDLIVGAIWYDNYMVLMSSRDPAVYVIDTSETVTTIHQTGKDGNSAGHSRGQGNPANAFNEHKRVNLASNNQPPPPPPDGPAPAAGADNPMNLVKWVQSWINQQTDADDPGSVRRSLGENSVCQFADCSKFFTTWDDGGRYPRIECRYNKDWNFKLQHGYETDHKIEYQVTGDAPLEYAHYLHALEKCPKAFFYKDKWEKYGCNDFFTSTMSIEERSSWLEQAIFGCTWEVGWEVGNDIIKEPIRNRLIPTSWQACQEMCVITHECRAWTYLEGQKECVMKRSINHKFEHEWVGDERRTGICDGAQPPAVMESRAQDFHGCPRIATKRETVLSPPRMQSFPSEQYPDIPFIWTKGWYAAMARVKSAKKYESYLWYFSQGTEYLMSKDELEAYIKHQLGGGHSWLWLRLGSNKYNSDVMTFALHFAAKIDHPYYLVTSDGDSGPNEANRWLSSDATPQMLLDAPNLVIWFSQNCDAQISKKLQYLPIGIDMHGYTSAIAPTPQSRFDVFKTTVKRQKLFKHRSKKIFLGYFGAHGDEREKIQKLLKDNQKCDDLIHRHENKESVQWTWNSFAAHQFVVSFTGGGIDAHRTWETLYLGAVPVLGSTAIDPMFRNLPVVILKDWHDLCNAENVEAWSRRFSSYSRNETLKRLSASWWLSAKPCKTLQLSLREHHGAAPALNQAAVNKEQACQQMKQWGEWTVCVDRLKFTARRQAQQEFSKLEGNGQVFQNLIGPDRDYKNSPLRQFKPKPRTKTKSCTVFSYGLRKGWKFDDGAEIFGCDLYGFDPSYGPTGPKAYGTRKKFASLSLGATKETHQRFPHAWPGVDYMRGFNVQPWQVEPFTVTMKHLGKTFVDLIKIDINGSEWTALSAALEDGHITRKTVGQLLVKVYFDPLDSNADRVNKLKLFSALDKIGLVPFHVTSTSHYAYAVALIWRDELGSSPTPRSALFRIVRHKMEGDCDDEEEAVVKRTTDHKSLAR